MGWLWRRISRFDVFLFALTLSTLLALPVAVKELLRSESVAAFTFLAVVFAWFLSFPGKRQRLREAILFRVVPLGIFISVGNLLPALMDMLRGGMGYLLQLADWFQRGIQPDASDLLLQSGLLVLRVTALVLRLWDWGRLTLGGRPFQDPSVSVLGWGLVTWLLSAWAVWSIRRRGAVLAGVAPATIVMGLVLNYTGTQRMLFIFHVGGLLLLMGAFRYDALRLGWQSRRVDYAENILFDSSVALVFLTASLLFSATLLSSVSVREILDRWRDSHRQIVENGEAPRMDVTPSTPVVVHEAPRLSGVDLPNRHLLGSSLELSEQVVMTIATGDLPPGSTVDPPRYYWRAQTYAIYTGAGWANVLGENTLVPADTPLVREVPASYRVVHQEVTLYAPEPRLFWTGAFLRADEPVGVIWSAPPEAFAADPLSRADVLSVLGQASSYQVDSFLPIASVEQLHATSADYPAWVRDSYLSLPQSTPERVLRLARDLTLNAVSPYDRARAIEGYLRQFPYSLEVTSPPPGRDVTDYFLFDLQKGYCDYYATAMVVLARAAGLPARFVSGYSSGTYSPDTALYTVTRANAHSWVEIYLGGIGWVEFEPTSGQPELVRTGENAISIVPSRALWLQTYLWIPLRAMLFRLLDFLQLPGLIFVLMIFGWWLYDNQLEPRLFPLHSIERSYGRLRRQARRWRVPLSGSQTTLELAQACADRSGLPRREKAIHALADIYTRALFSPKPVSAADALTASRLSRRLWI